MVDKGHKMVSRNDELAATQLSLVPSGSRVRLVSHDCGRGLAARLEAMGLRPGVELEVIKTASWGPAVIALGACRLALGKGIISRITVAPVDHS